MWWLTALALAGPPAGIDLEDPVPWGDAASTLLDGPPGCWEVVGKAAWSYRIGRLGSLDGTAAFVGRLEDGVWSELRVEPLGEVVVERDGTESRIYPTERHFAPLMGRHVPTEVSVSAGDDEVRTESRRIDGDPVNGVREALDELTEAVETSYVSWDDERDGLELVRTMVLQGSGKEVLERTFFPGGQTAPVAQELEFPSAFSVHAVPPVRVHDARVRLRSRVRGGVAFPLTEVLTLQVKTLGITSDLAQTVTYYSYLGCE